jgi:hypothetical protein
MVRSSLFLLGLEHKTYVEEDDIYEAVTEIEEILDTWSDLFERGAKMEFAKEKIEKALRILQEFVQPLDFESLNLNS